VLGSNHHGEWSVYTLLLLFYDQILLIATRNILRIDVLALYTDSSVEQAYRVLWSILHLDLDQLPYMEYAMQWIRNTLAEASEVHVYSDYVYTEWVADLCVMSADTEQSLARHAVESGVSVGQLFGLDVNARACFLELLIQETALPVYYTRMVDKILLIIGGISHKSTWIHRLYHLVDKNRIQLEDVLYNSKFEIQSITGHEVEFEDILLLVEMMFEELLPRANVASIFTETESRRDRHATDVRRGRG
jgi:hypothetical protein